MPKPDMGKKINVLHIVEFALSIGTAFCMADNAYGGHLIEFQFITATAYGSLMILSVLFLAMFFAEEAEQKTDLTYDAMLGIMNIISGILVLLYSTDRSGSQSFDSLRLLVGSACYIANGVVLLVEFFLLIFKKDLLLGGGD